MNRKYSLALHDLRVSGGENTVNTIKHVMNLFEVPLTVHLIFDGPLEKNTVLSTFIIENSKDKRLEIVFHGLTHKCSKDVSGLLAFYHKYQAEYLNNSDSIRTKTAEIYQSVCSLLDETIGICPPCWIATKRNFRFFRTLHPLYIESLLSLTFKWRKIFSPVISLGSPNNDELFFLKGLAHTMYFLSILMRRTRLRIAIHQCDLEKSASMIFFLKTFQALNRHGFQPVLLKDLQQ